MAQADENNSAPSYDAQVTLAKRALSVATAAGDEDAAAAARAELLKITKGKDPAAEPVERAVKSAPEKAAPRAKAPAKRTAKA